MMTITQNLWGFAKNVMVAFIFACLFPISIVNAYVNDEIYTVSDVKVDVKAGSAVEAQKEAIRQAHKKAFEMLVERLVPEEERSSLSDVTPDEIERFVDGYEVNNQKQSNVRFIASMTFYFQEKAVRNFLGGHTVRAVQVSKPPMVIVPVLIDHGAITLWGDENPWLHAWTRRERISAVVPIEVPIGDLRDISTIDGMQVISGQVAPLNDLARRYGAAGAVVAILKRDSRDPMASMALEMSILDLDGSLTPLTDQPYTTAVAPADQQFDQAINMVVKKLETYTHQGNAPGMAASVEQELTVRIPFQSPQMWMSIQKTLKFSGAVREFSLKSLSRSEALVSLKYKGTPASLGSALGAQGLQLEQLNGSTWVIRQIGAGNMSPSSS